MKIKCEWTDGEEQDVNEVAKDYAEYRLEYVWECIAPQSFEDCSDEEFAAIEKAFFKLRVVLPEEVPNQ